MCIFIFSLTKLFSGSPSNEEFSSTPPDKETSFTFNHQQQSMHGTNGNNEGKMRYRGDLDELVRVVLGHEERFEDAQDDPIDEDRGGGLQIDEDQGVGSTEDLSVQTKEDLLSDGFEGGELSPLTECEDDFWWWITRSPCVPSARKIPHYLEDKENIFAQIKRRELNRKIICENINRIRREAKRGRQKTKERYAQLTNQKLTFDDVESVLNTACTNIKASTEIDGLQETLRDQLLSIQKTYRERHRELARLTPKNKDK